jgi:hypothetical protein
MPGIAAVRSAWRSPALRAAVVLGLSGVAFALANLLLARVLPKEEYGLLALVLAISRIGISTGALGANVIVNRQQVDPGWRLIRRTLGTSTLVAGILAIAAGALYPLNPPFLAVVAGVTIAGSLKLVAVGHYQSRQRYGYSLLLSESTNLSLLIAASGAAVIRSQTAMGPALWFTLCLAAFAAAAWRSVARDRAGLGYPDPPFPWGEAFSVAGVVSAGIVLMVVERLVIPRTLGLATLATFSVLVTLAGSPFQMLSEGVGFALVPNLRAAADASARRAVLRHETAVVVGACILSAAAVWWLAPLVAHWFLAGRYELPTGLILAAIVVGSLKPLGSLAVGTVNAVGSSAALVGLSGIAWLAVGTGLAGAWLGAPWGLTGLIYGAGVGWLLRALAGIWLAARCLRIAPAEGPAQGEIPALLTQE